MHEIVFENGIKIDDIKKPIKKDSKGKKHGTIVSFIPSSQFLGKNVEIPIDMLVNWIDDISYQVSNKIKFRIDIYDGLAKLETLKFKPKPFYDYINKVINKSNMSVEPVSFHGCSTITEDVLISFVDNEKVKQKKEKKEKVVDIDVSFSYDKEASNSNYKSFCNFTFTEEGGVHESSVEECICRYLQQKTKNNLSEREKNKLDITWADVKCGLQLAVNLSTDAQVQFMGNAKNKIQNEALKPVLKAIVMEQLEKVIPDNSAKLNALCKIIKLNATVRQKANETRVSITAKKTDKFSSLDLKAFTDCNGKDPSKNRIFLVEGAESAAGGIVNARDPETQAVFGFRGCTKNPYICSFDECMSNEEWSQYVKAIGCGIGKGFNINKLAFDKIILATDADIDGYYISAGICGFHVLHLPEIITTGHFYRVYPPLYTIDDKNHPIVKSKHELVDVYFNKVAKKYKIAIDGNDYMTKSELVEFLLSIEDYYSDLIELRDYCKVNMFLIEIIMTELVCSGVVRSVDDYDSIEDIFSNQKFITSLMSRVQREFPELKLIGNKIIGSIDNHYASITINDRFIRKMYKFINIYQEYGYILAVNDKTNVQKMSIGRLFESVQHMIPKKQIRFKGLAEYEPELLWDTTLNPATCSMIRLTMDDCERTIETFRNLQGNRKVDKEWRKRTMDKYRISLDDLDS